MKSKEAKVNAFDGCFKWPIYTKLMGVFTFYIATAFTITAINLDQLHHTNEPAEEHHDNEVVSNFRVILSVFSDENCGTSELRVRLLIIQ